MMIGGVLLLASVPSLAQATMEPAAGVAPEGVIQVTGVAAGEFQPQWWEAGTLNLNFDARAPLLEPREGPFRNIYAPSAVRTEDGWLVYYGAWDGVETGNDRIYVTSTEDFVSFGDRQMVIDHGPYTHVCNCSVVRLPDDSFRMACTAYPHREGGQNRPVTFSSPDGLTWNGSLPHVAGYSDLATIEGYSNWENAELNGVNAILYEDGVYRLYFLDWLNSRQVHRASSEDFRTFTYDGPVYDGTLAVNDLRRFDLGDETWYLVAAHLNCDTLWYSLSRDGMSFAPAHVLAKNQSAADRYIVAVGWVTDGNRVLGFLYGAGAISGLTENRIFAKWLQKKVVFHADDGRTFAEASALGPDTVLLSVPDGVTSGYFTVYAEDGVSVLARTATLSVTPRQCWGFSPAK